jgi:hypothetical protein
VPEKDRLITELADNLLELRRSFDFIDKAVWDAHQVPELIEKAQALTPGNPTATKMRGSAVTDGDAFVKIEGIVEGY